MKLILTLSVLLIAASLGCAQDPAPKPADSKQQKKAAAPKVTFVELGSVTCIPCKKMQPVMKAIEEKYGDQIKVIFYDVWKPDQKQYAQQYNVKMIPTQVFLDEKGNEFFRHTGFYPEKSIDKILAERGLKPLTVKVD